MKNKKRTLCLRMIGNRKVKGFSIFDSIQWIKRRLAIAERVDRKLLKIKTVKAAQKAALAKTK